MIGVALVFVPVEDLYNVSCGLTEALSPNAIEINSKILCVQSTILLFIGG